MRPLLHEIGTAHSPESLLARLAGEPGVVALRSAAFDSPQARYSFVTARPFLTFCAWGSRCEIQAPEGGNRTQFGNPWQVLDALMARYELLVEADLPFPLGGCFGYWGYDLKNFVEPRLPRRAVNDLELPDCHVGFYASLVVFDHHLGKTWVVATGLDADGARTDARAAAQVAYWREHLTADAEKNSLRPNTPSPGRVVGAEANPDRQPQVRSLLGERAGVRAGVTSNLSRTDFLAAVDRVLRYIHAGDIYQVNLAQRLTAPCPFSGPELFARLTAVSPAPFAAYVDCGDFQLASSSPELFLRLSGAHILTRPIKGTRPRASDPTRDAQLAYELQTRPKELAELVMITVL
ncbi:MAG TPA: chorismate-binding protein, partial [Dongiaceae bacterium]|nr:chorismate-binding protein [Dongiaceae bacterium]